MDIYQIDNSNLALGYILLVIPVFFLWYFQTGLVKDTLISAIRMTIQLLLVGVYLEYIFEINSWWINFLWVVVMVFIASYTITKRSGLTIKVFILPILFSISISLLIIDTYFFGLVIRLDNFFDARYFIPITGMLLGNCLRTNIIALNSFYLSLKKDETLYRFFIANGATRNEAIKYFMRDSLQKAFNPTIATMSVIGLISLPGMMTGQILGGSSPNVAIKYQIMLMLTIFVSAMISVILSILLSNLFIFNKFDNLKYRIIDTKGL
ncbi:MAG: ABC transporter permease [Bacteroidetes bacterium]|jgi:putative ABC transport system permease protein|nr:ABC transporter permease [Bacteroidota bacterium]MBT6685029.1 ABC transporter permease [Bacteroidota bacterium]MBT7143107.1 ABC transporter permease [Bacteroidota bacterium]MBT7491480.1 ABC transporter permease [Bacteroidota bacterium]